MPTTAPEAYDTITNRLIAEWTANAVDITDAVAPAPELRFSGIEKGEIPATYFARFHLQTVFERQANMRNGDTGSQRYTSGGLIFVQVFAPRTDELALERLRLLGRVAKLIFRGKTFDGCIWFRNVRVNELDPETNFLRANMVAEHEYDEVG